ncbi:hypothetical protein HMPREF1868_01379 [Olsenella sp. DNF00959]|nr:hypothetical protein HMPREF1868_01379 [Olsenella sp. DNF00959]
MRRRSARPSRLARSLCEQLRPCRRSLCRRGPPCVLYASRRAPAGVLYASLLLLAHKTPVGTEAISEMCIENVGGKKNVREEERMGRLRGRKGKMPEAPHTPPPPTARPTAPSRQRGEQEGGGNARG